MVNPLGKFCCKEWEAHAELVNIYYSVRTIITVLFIISIIL